MGVEGDEIVQRAPGGSPACDENQGSLESFGPRFKSVQAHQNQAPTLTGWGFFLPAPHDKELTSDLATYNDRSLVSEPCAVFPLVHFPENVIVVGQFHMRIMQAVHY